MLKKQRDRQAAAAADSGGSGGSSTDTLKILSWGFNGDGLPSWATTSIIGSGRINNSRMEAPPGNNGIVLKVNASYVGKLKQLELSYTGNIEESYMEMKNRVAFVFDDDIEYWLTNGCSVADSGARHYYYYTANQNGSFFDFGSHSFYPTPSGVLQIFIFNRRWTHKDGC